MASKRNFVLSSSNLPNFMPENNENVASKRVGLSLRVTQPSGFSNKAATASVKQQQQHGLTTTFESSKQNGQLRERAPLSQINEYINQKQANRNAAASVKPTSFGVPIQNKPIFSVFHELSPEKDENEEEELIENDENVPIEIDESIAFDDNACDDVILSLRSSGTKRQPLSTLRIEPDDLTQDSPMIHDVSRSSTSKVLPHHMRSPRKLSSTINEETRNVDVYAQEIYEHMRDLELRSRPNPNYMSKQEDITYGMRSILVDWLVDVNGEYNMQPETLYLSVNYIDQFMSIMGVARNKLQLLGTSSCMIAAKFEEIYPPDLDEFVYITDNTYTLPQVIRMEKVILKVLQFGLSGPTPYWFLQRFCYLHNVDERCHHLAMYLCELTLLESDPFLVFLPSIIAGSALCLACHTLEIQPWSSEMMDFTGYSMSDFRDCMEHLLRTYQRAAHYPQQAVRAKYCKEMYSCVANIHPPLLPPF